MKQFFWWFLVAVFAVWTAYSAYQLAVGCASAAKREGPWANQPNVPWPNAISEQMLFIVLGLLSSIVLTLFATNSRWEQELRENCKCDELHCHCKIDAELVYGRPN